MKKSKHLIIPFLAAVLLFLGISCTSCTKEVKDVNFTVNGVSLPARESIPGTDMDTIHVMNVFVGDEVMFEDASMPKDIATKWDWDLDGDGASNVEERIHMTVFPKQGYYKVRFCVNGMDHCVSKIIYAMDKPVDNAPPSRPVTIAKVPKTPRPYVGPRIVVTPAPLPPTPPVAEPAPPPTPTAKKGYSELMAFPQSNTECGSFDKSSFSVTLSPNEDCDLTSVYVWSDESGLASINISGGGDSENMKAALTKGRNLIALSGLDISLKKGGQYVLRFDGKAKGDDDAPKFRNGGSCALSSRQTTALNMSNNNYLYDLKFSYRK